MSKTVVYSCVTGNYDKMSETILASRAQPEEDVSYVLFTDGIDGERVHRAEGSDITWSVRPPHWKHQICRRRTARWHKLNSHVLFPDAEYTVWLDGSQRIKTIRPYYDLVAPYLVRHNIATFKHPNRTCVFQEIEACKMRRKDNHALMDRQAEAYRKASYPPFNGMVETACLVRRNCIEVSRFNNVWWDQMVNHSYRDQLSFNYTAWMLKQDYGLIPGCRDKSKFFDFVMHGST